jgi:hypothetical protein
MSNTWQTDSEQPALNHDTTALRDHASRHNEVVSELWNHSDSVNTTDHSTKSSVTPCEQKIAIEKQIRACYVYICLSFLTLS